VRKKKKEREKEREREREVDTLLRNDELLRRRVRKTRWNVCGWVR
jgi:predicted RNase H-like nuclease